MLSEKQAKDYQFYLDNMSTDWAKQFLKGQRLDYMLSTLNNTRIYYQVNFNKRDNNFNLYAKLSLPKKLLRTQKSLAVGVFCAKGTEWTDSLKTKARNKLISLAFSRWSSIL